MAEDESKLGNWQEAIDSIVKDVRDTKDFEDFMQLKSDVDRIAFIFGKGYLEKIHWLKVYFSQCRGMNRKSAEKSDTLRNEGNKYFQKRLYTKALDMYSKSVLTAPDTPDQPELALAFGNRSAALLHLGRHQDCLADVETCHFLLQDCLADVERALSTHCPDATRPKLLKRKAECLEKLENSVQTPFTQPEKASSERVHSKNGNAASDPTLGASPVSHGSNPVITQASGALELCCSEEQGRFLVAREAVEAGDVLIVERPFAAVLLPDHYSSHCHHCFQQLSSPPFPCPECCLVSYCSTECQQSSWQQYHRVECCYLNLMHSIGIAHLSLRIVLTAGMPFLRDFMEENKMERKRGRGIAGVDEEGKYSRGYLSVYDLMPHTQDMLTEDLFQYSLTAALLLIVLAHAEWFMDEDVHLKALKKLNIKDTPKTRQAGGSLSLEAQRNLSDTDCLAHSCPQELGRSPECLPVDSATETDAVLQKVSGDFPACREHPEPNSRETTLSHREVTPNIALDISMNCSPSLQEDNTDISLEERKKVSKKKVQPPAPFHGTMEKRVLDLRHWAPHVVPRQDGLLVGGLLLRHIQQLVCNAHAISELQVEEAGDDALVQSKSQQRIATAIYPTASLMNHACCPSIISSFDGDVLLVRAVKDVPVGGEIFNCYGPDSRRMNRAERQRCLLEQYFFHCQCSDCESDSTQDLQFQALSCLQCGGRVDVSETPACCVDCGQSDLHEVAINKAREADDLFVQGLKALQGSDVKGALKRFQQCQSLRQEALHPNHKHLGEVNDCLARCHAMLGQFSQAADHMEPSVRLTELQYGPDSVQLGQELHKQAQILFNARRPEQALEVIDRATSVLSMHFGPNHEMVQELQDMKMCLDDFMCERT